MVINTTTKTWLVPLSTKFQKWSTAVVDVLMAFTANDHFLRKFVSDIFTFIWTKMYVSLKFHYEISFINSSAFVSYKKNIEKKIIYFLRQ